jgi:hypothetical protein
MAVTKFPVDPLKLNAVGSLTAGGNPITITATGEKFGDNMTAEWIDPTKSITVILPRARQFRTLVSLGVEQPPSVGRAYALA